MCCVFSLSVVKQMMGWLEIFFYIFLVYLLIQLMRLLLADADLSLSWKEKYGLKPGKLLRIRITSTIFIKKNNAL